MLINIVVNVINVMLFLQKVLFLDINLHTIVNAKLAIITSSFFDIVHFE